MWILELSQIIILLPSIVGMFTLIILFLNLRQQKKEFNEKNKPLIYIGDKNFGIRFNQKETSKFYPHSWSDDNAINTEYHFDIFNIGNKPAINLEYYWDWNTNSSEYLRILKSLDSRNKFKLTWEKSAKFNFLCLEDSQDGCIDSYAIDKNVPIKFAPFLIPFGSSESIYLDEGIILPKILSLKARDILKNPKFPDAEFQNITKEDLKLPGLNLKIFYEDSLGNKYCDLFRIYLNKEFYPLEINKINKNIFDIKGTFKVFKISTSKMRKS